MAAAEPRPSRPYRGTASAERVAARRDRLIAAAVRLYGEAGYARTSVLGVCRAAGLTERYFYESFANSAELLAAAFDRVVDQLLRLLDDTNAASAGLPDARQRLHRLVGAYYAALRAEPAAARVFLIEINGVSARTEALFDASLDRLIAPMLALLDPGGIGPAAHDRLVRRGIAGGLLHIALAWIADGYRRPLDEVIAAALPLCALARPDRPVSASV